MNEQKQDVTQKPKKKRKIITTVLLISLLLNLLLGAALNYTVKDDSEYEDMFRTEISFAMQRFEEVNKKYDQNNYMVGVAHLYTACVMTAEFEEDNIASPIEASPCGWYCIVLPTTFATLLYRPSSRVCME